MDSSGSYEEQPVITVHAKTIPTRMLINFFILSLRSLAHCIIKSIAYAIDWHNGIKIVWCVHAADDQRDLPVFLVLQ